MTDEKKIMKLYMGVMRIYAISDFIFSPKNIQRGPFEFFKDPKKILEVRAGIEENMDRQRWGRGYADEPGRELIGSYYKFIHKLGCLTAPRYFFLGTRYPDVSVSTDEVVFGTYEDEPEESYHIRYLVPFVLKPSWKIDLLLDSLPQSLRGNLGRKPDIKTNLFIHLYPSGACVIWLIFYIGTRTGLTVEDVITLGRVGLKDIEVSIRRGKQGQTYSIHNLFEELKESLLTKILYRVKKKLPSYTHSLIHILEMKDGLKWDAQTDQKAIFGLVSLLPRWDAVRKDLIARKLKNKLHLYQDEVIVSTTTGTLIYTPKAKKRTWKNVRRNLMHAVEIAHVQKLLSKECKKRLEICNQEIISKEIDLKRKLRSWKEITPIDLEILLNVWYLSGKCVQSLSSSSIPLYTKISKEISLRKSRNLLEKERQVTLSLLEKWNPPLLQAAKLALGKVAQWIK